MEDLSKPRVALVHDCLVHVGGAERTLKVLQEAFPNAPIYTLVFDRRAMEGDFPVEGVHTSFVQRLPGSARFFRAYAPLYPMAVESFDFSDFDVVISSSSAFAKGVLTPTHACHICYCHTPLRYLWSEYQFYRGSIFGPPWKQLFVDPILNYLRMWDRLAADRVDYFVANSEATAARIAKYYRRNSCVMHPPVRVKPIQLARSSGDYFLLAARLMPYKRVDLAVQAFNELRLPLKIVGTGPQLGELRRQARPNIEFLGTVSDAVLAECYALCRAFVYPAIEDFGIVMVEAQGYGKPVIASSGGGASEIVLDGRTGILVREQSVAALAEAVTNFSPLRFDPEEIREHALRFDESEFIQRIRRFVEEKFVETRTQPRRWLSNEQRHTAVGTG